ncbi:MAG: hypothetical protein ACOCV8_02630 [Spirochaetota bacterium]
MYSQDNDETVTDNQSDSEDSNKNLSESDIKNIINSLIKKGKFEEAEEYYSLLIELYPNTNNIINYGSFIAEQERYKEASEIWRSTLETLTYDYKAITDLYLKYHMYEELLKLYKDVNEEKLIKDYFLIVKTFDLYDVLEDYNGKSYYIMELLETSSESLYKSLINYIIDEVSKEEPDTNILIKSLDNFVKNNETLNIEQITKLQNAIAIGYFHQQKYQNSYLNYAELIKKYHQLLINNKDERINILNSIEDVIDDFVSVSEYSKAVKLLNLSAEIYKSDSTYRYMKYLIKKAEILETMNIPEKSLVYYKHIIGIIEMLFNSKNSKILYGREAYTNLLYKAYYNLSRIFYEKKLFQDAISYLMKINNPSISYDSFYLIGKCFLALQDLDKAEEYLIKSKNFFNYYDNIKTYYYLAIIALINNQTAKSVNLFEHIIINAGIEYSEYAVKALLIYDILLSMIENDTRLKKFIDFNKLYYSFKYELILSHTEYLKLDYTTISYYPEDIYYHFKYIDILNKKKQYKKILDILSDDIKDSRLKDIAEGYYYQKVVLLYTENILNNFEIKDIIDLELVNSYKDIEELLFNLLIEYPNTIFLNRIKKLLIKVRKLNDTDEKNE